MADKKITMLYGLLTSIASKITYDNTTSGLEADNVQDAIDEVKSDVDPLYNVVSTTLTYPSGLDVIYSRVGKLVIVSLGGNLINYRIESADWNILGDIPVGYRPAAYAHTYAIYESTLNKMIRFAFGNSTWTYPYKLGFNAVGVTVGQTYNLYPRGGMVVYITDDPMPTS